MAADLEIISVYATRTLTLATTVKKIWIDPSVFGQISGIYVYCATAAAYQVDSVAGEPTSATAPTVDWFPIGAETYIPLTAGVHAPDGGFWIGVWAVADTPVLHVAPVAVSR